MRLAIWHDPPPGGAQRAFTELLTRLAERHTIDVIQPSSGEHPSSPPAYANELHLVSYQPHRLTRGAPYWNDWRAFRNLQALQNVERTLAADIDGRGYDVVLTSVLRTALAPSLNRFLRTPNAYYCHEPPRRFYEPWCRPEANPLTRYERARRIWRWPAQACLDEWSRRADVRNVRAAGVVLTNSRHTAANIRAIYGREAEVCYLGVDTQNFRPAASLAPPTALLSVGALEAHKGFDFIIRALGRIHPSRRPMLSLVGRVGHPRMPDVLRRQAAQAGVQLAIHGGLSDAELAELYRSHALFVFAANHEPFGLVALEAMASGLPVVAVDEGGLRESVRHGRSGYLVPRDEAQFAGAVEKLLQDGDARRTFGHAAREDAVINWGWDRAASGVEDQLLQCAGHSSQPVLRNRVSTEPQPPD